MGQIMPISILMPLWDAWRLQDTTMEAKSNTRHHWVLRKESRSPFSLSDVLTVVTGKLGFLLANGLKLVTRILHTSHRLRINIQSKG